ncbi:hypothetical protein PG990_008438 [Apiospora arundinis]
MATSTSFFAMHPRRMLLSLPLLTSYLLLMPAVLADKDPIGVPWSAKTYGPDGPWPAVEIALGGNQHISLYPGNEYATVLIPTDYCSYNMSIACQASSAGLYTKVGTSSPIKVGGDTDYMRGLPVKGEKMEYWMDEVDLLDGSGIVTPNVSLNLANRSFSSYPNGNLYPLSVGCLGLGAPDRVNQSFSRGALPPINASLIPGNLYERGKIESNSFGMHIGSANPKMPGSLYFGGYDQNRIVGDVLTSTESTHREIPLKDIAIKVIDGASPWSFGASQEGLLAQGNSSIGSRGIQVQVDGCSPYLTLPKSTCDAIAQHLPVTYDAGLGLYTWNTGDAKYSQIVGSASALVFTFLGSTNTDKKAIAVPFRHLNLTLDRPLVDGAPRPYFPCFTGSDASYALGRAFLQDAFLGANWGARTWFLAQAPGPNVPSSKIVKFDGAGGSVAPSQNDWKESWAGSWKALTPAEAGSTTAIAPPDDHAPSNAVAEDGGLSTGAKAGIGAGAGVGALALLGAAVFFWLRHRKAKKAKGGTEGSNFNGNGNNNDIIRGGGAPGGSTYHPSSTYDSTLYSASEAKYSNSQHASHGYDIQGAHPQAYSAELSATFNAQPSELPASARMNTQPGAPPPPHSSDVQQ